MLVMYSLSPWRPCTGFYCAREILIELEIAYCIERDFARNYTLGLGICHRIAHRGSAKELAGDRWGQEEFGLWGDTV